MNKVFNETSKIHVVIDNINESSQDLIVNYIEATSEVQYEIHCFKDKVIILLESKEDIIEYIEEVLLVCTPDDSYKEFIVKGLEENNTSLTNKIFKHDKINNKIKDGPYKNMKPAECLEKYGLVAMIELQKNEPYYEEIKDVILKDIKTYVKRYEGITNTDVHNTNIEEIKNFIKLSETLLETSIKNILNRATYKSVDDFLQAPEPMLRSAYFKLVHDLAKI